MKCPHGNNLECIDSQGRIFACYCNGGRNDYHIDDMSGPTRKWAEEEGDRLSGLSKINAFAYLANRGKQQ